MSSVITRNYYGLNDIDNVRAANQNPDQKVKSLCACVRVYMCVRIVHECVPLCIHAMYYACNSLMYADIMNKL